MLTLKINNDAFLAKQEIILKRAADLAEALYSVPRGPCGGAGVGAGGVLGSISNNNSSVMNNNNVGQGGNAVGSAAGAMGVGAGAGMFGAMSMGHMPMPYAMSMPPMRPLGAMGMPPQYASHLNQLSINVNTHAQLPFAFHGAGAHQSWDDGSLLVPIS